MADNQLFPTETETTEAVAQAEPAVPLTAKERRAAAYKVYYERRKDEILSTKKETYNQIQKRNYYNENKDHLNERMRKRYNTKKEDEIKEKLLLIKERFPCNEMKAYIDKLISDEVFKQFTPKMIEFWSK